MRKLTAKQVALIRANKNLPVRDAARRAGVSVGSASAILSSPAPTRSTPAPSGVEPETAATPVERLTRAVKSLEHAARVAAADGDQARVVAALRAVSDVTKTIAALTPPAPVDQNENPDMIEAARLCREAIFGMFDRIVAEGAVTT